jgi:hypothetical protein
MRILTILSALFVLSIIFLTGDALSQKFEYSSLTVSEDESVIFDGDQLWIEGDMLIDGDLTIKNSHIHVNRSLDLTVSEIRINSTGKLDLVNTTVTTTANETYGTTTYTLVSDGGELSIQDSQIYYSMLWLVGGNASITNLLLDGYSLPNYGIFSEDTNLIASGVSIRNYTLGLRAIGSSPTLESVFYYNCSTWMTQEWWVTFSPVEESTGLPISGFEIRQWDTDGNMIGTWNWAKQFEVNSEGQMVNHITNFSSYLNLHFAYIADEWEQQITANTDIIRSYNMNSSSVRYNSAILFVDGVPLASGQIVPKWSEINISVVIDNPTDMNFNNLYLDLAVNGEPGFARTSLKLPAGNSQRTNLTWMASVEGPLSLGVSTIVVDYSGNLTDTTMSFSKFVEVEGSAITSKTSGLGVALLAVFIVLSLCSYIIYSGIEEDTESPDTEVKEDTEVEEDEHLRELALPQETEEEKEN